MNNEFISIMTERIVREFDPLQIILFGSQARGDADRHSDIDLLVVFAELTDKRKTAIDLERALSDVPSARLAVVVGTAPNPARIRQVNNIPIRTLWGDIAAQLGVKMDMRL